VRLDAIASNYRLLVALAGGRAVYPVVKADAYGHGAVPVARRLAREGAACFAVASVEEAVALRRGGVPGDILILGVASPAAATICRAYGLTPAVHDPDQARGLARETASFERPLPVHVKLDTGMGRLGVRPEGVAELARSLAGAAHLSVVGAFTQLASGEDPAPEPTATQLGRLEAGLATLRAAGLAPSTVHVASSGAILAHPESLFDAVRPGLALYGVLPSESLEDPGLAPAMELVTRIAAVKRVPAGEPLGYGGAFVTTRTSLIASLPIGYHDGFRRAFSGKTAVLLRGRRAPVVGMVSMDLTLVDATESGGAEGDEVVVMGRLAGDRVTAWDLARAASTVPWEILCGIGARVPRTYDSGGAA
jgi:alanine racemase